MPFVPALCDKCHTMFSSELYVRDTNINLSGIEVGSCPKCNSKGQVLSGIYKFTDYILKTLKARYVTIYELNVLHEILCIADEHNLHPKQIESEISVRLPSYLELMVLLPATKADFRLCLNLFKQIIYAVIDISVEINKIINRTDGIIKIQGNIKTNQIIDQVYTNNTNIKRRLF